MAPATPPLENADKKMSFGTTCRQLWIISKAFFVSKRRYEAARFLAALLILALCVGGVQLLMSYVARDFMTAIAKKNAPAYWQSLWWYLGTFGLAVPLGVYYRWTEERLALLWREWMAQHLIRRYFNNRAYYRLRDSASIDNPDQRISEDVQWFVEKTLGIGLGLMNAVVTLVSFITILWTLSGTLTVPLPGGGEIGVPGYMCWVALLYAALGTWLTGKIGAPLVGLNFNQQRLEADFRFRMVRLRENSEAVALWHGEEAERLSLKDSFLLVVGNFRAIMTRQKSLTWFTSSYNQIAIIFPFVVAAPRFFAKEIQLGGLMQTASAFGQVQSSLSFIVNAFSTIAEWKAVVDRLTGFTDSLDRIDEMRAAAGIDRAETDQPGVEVKDLAVDVPDGRRLFERLSLVFHPRTSVLITGATGSGKSSLMRSIAGIWPFGAGLIRLPRGKRLLFLSQKPYLPVGALRQALLFPGGITADDKDLAAVLADVGLARLADQLDRSENWQLMLSGGAQQRVSLARALLNRPDFVFLDEATSALDEASESSLYRLIRERLPEAGIVSIGHRSTLKAFHDQEIKLAAAAAPAAG